jgi:hypothetical protein
MEMAGPGGLMAEMKSRLIRVVDYIAEFYEAEAGRMPLSMKERAEIYRQMARDLRQSDNPRMVRILEELGGIEGPDFIMSDSDSH